MTRKLRLYIAVLLSFSGQSLVAQNEQDIMVGYTEAARDSRGGTDSIIAQIREGLLNTNLAHERSQTNALVVERMIGEFTISEAGRDIGAVLGEWRRKRGGTSFGQDQAFWETELGIDFAMIISNVNSGSSNGQAENTGVYSSIRASRITEPTLPHELGHNYGCIHSRGLFDFANEDGQLRRTLLESRGAGYGRVLNNYSNPDVSAEGAVTGTANQNNAGRINENSLILTNIRPRNTNPSPTGGGVLLGGLLFVEGFRYSDGGLTDSVNAGNSWSAINGDSGTVIAQSANLIPTHLVNFRSSGGGGAVQTDGTRHAIALPSNAVTGENETTRYISFLHRLADDSGNRSQFVEFWQGDPTLANTTFFFGTDSTSSTLSYGLRLKRGSENTEVNIGSPDTETHLIVIKVEYGADDADQISVYIDPGATEPAVPVVTATATDLAFDRFGFGSFQGGGQTIDEVRIGESYESVVPVLQGLLFEENFSYENGTLAGNSNGLNSWENVLGSSTAVETPSLDASSFGDLVAVGGRAVQPNGNRVSLALPSAAHGGSDNTEIYVSFLHKLSDVSGNRTQIVEFWDGSATDANNSIFFGIDATTSLGYGLRLDRSDQNILVDLPFPDTNVHLVVFKIEYGANDEDRISAYIDPGSSEPETPDVMATANDLSFTRIGFGAFQNSSQEIDEFRIGASYADVLPQTSQPLFVESFDFPSGDLIGQSTAGNVWGDEFGDDSAQVLEGSISLPQLPQYEAQGGRVNQIASDRSSLVLPQNVAGGDDSSHRYISFIQRFNDADAKSKVVEFWKGEATTNNTAFSFGTDTNPVAPDYGLLIDKGGSNLAFDLGSADLEPHLIVIRVDYNQDDQDTIRVYIDPGADEPEVPDAISTGENLEFDRIGFGSFQGGSQQVDEIRIGLSYSSVVPLAEVPDSDGDGLPDAFEILNYGSITATDGTQDFDGDGQNDRSEFAAGTDASDSTSVFGFTSDGIARDGGDQITLRWTSVLGKTYSIWTSTTLASDDWMILVPSVPAAGSETSQGITADGDLRFFQIRVNSVPVP